MPRLRQAAELYQGMDCNELAFLSQYALWIGRSMSVGEGERLGRTTRKGPASSGEELGLRQVNDSGWSHLDCRQGGGRRDGC